MISQPHPKKWLIRKIKKHYIGPLDTEFVKKLILESEISGYDEIAREDSPWVYLKDCPPFSDVIYKMGLDRDEEKTVNLSLEERSITEPGGKSRHPQDRKEYDTKEVMELEKKTSQQKRISYKLWSALALAVGGTIIGSFLLKGKKVPLGESPSQVILREESEEDLTDRPLEALSEAFQKFNILFFQAKLEEASGEIEKAMSLYQEALALNPPLSHEIKIKTRLLSLHLQKNENPASLRTEFLKLLTLDHLAKSQISEIKNYLGIIELKENNLSKAHAYFQEANQQSPNSSPVHFNLGHTSFLQKQYYDARKYFERAVQLQPGSPLIYLYLGRTLEKLNKNEEAVQEYLNAQRINANLHLPYVYLSAVYLKMNQRKTAFSYLDQMLKKDPDYYGHYAKDFRYIQEKIDMQFLIKLLLPFLKEKNMPAHFLTTLGLLQYLDGELQGKKWIQKGIQVKEQDGAAAYTIWGYILKKEGDLENALLNLKTALRYQYQNSLTHALIADIQIRLGHDEEAVEHCRKILSFDPFYVKAYYLLGVALINLERIPEAQEAFNKALEYDPQYLPAKKMQASYSK